ncbi:glycogen synthase [Rheinheimera sp. UJ63]|uniref:glycogen synthase n=1 Tax=Rheinheimera sp. UJ63 TaxID=2910157 RepID=UPI001F3953A7|nr:glycogen/starch synthase [Rheinheimera sp. UJ63]MCF4009688.1 glycogen/starch synthase [Rheinheimera sp. UJ63]
MQILLLCSEYEGLIKTGGLADACYGLAINLKAAGHEVTVMLPRYAPLYSRPTGESDALFFELGGQEYGCAVRQLLSHDVDIRVVEHDDFFQRERPYDDGKHGYADNPLRFGFFCKAALEWAKHYLPEVDIIHGHDWQTGVAAAYLKQHYAHDPVLGGIPFVYTIHNGAYQLTTDHYWFGRLGLQANDDQFLNMLEQGIRHATKLNTVSVGYRDELMTEPAANGLSALYQRRAADFVGILNGCDYQQWDPATDDALIANFSIHDLSGKAQCKSHLRQRFNLAELDVPLFVAVSRITGQKGFDYLIPALRRWLPNTTAQVFLVGSGDAEYCRQLYQLQDDFNAQFRFFEGFDERLAHQTEAGGDFFLMPSLFEPCGLNQLYSLKYGTVPLVRLTGGLRDTVQPWPGAAATGIGFTEISVEAMQTALEQAETLYQQPKQYQQVQQRGMQQNFSWPAAVNEYQALYLKARNVHLAEDLCS